MAFDLDNPSHETLEITEVDSGEAVVMDKGVVRSEEFMSCNMYILKNLETGKVLFMHNYLGAPDEFKRHKETTDSYFLHKGKPTHGISVGQAPILKAFLKEKGEKVAFSAYKADHGWSEAAGVNGGSDDGGISQFLQSKGVKTYRHSIDYFEDLYPTLSSKGFHSEYDVEADRLKLSLAETIEGDVSKGESIFSHTFLPADHTGNLYDEALFDDLSKYKMPDRMSALGRIASFVTSGTNTR
ncbi:MAG: hypothetical protein MRY32_05445 [Rickettsiales bacterium]|nr:hypothetical protein [Rickettsiales bacterium]